MGQWLNLWVILLMFVKKILDNLLLVLKDIFKMVK